MLNLLFFGIVLSNSNSSFLTNKNIAQVSTKITTNVNGKETKVESNESGTIKVTNINGEVTIEKNNEIVNESPVLKIISNPSPSSSPIVFPSTQVLGVIQQEKQMNSIFQVFTRIFNIIKKIIIGT